MDGSQRARLALNDFLASVERRAFCRAQLATRNRDDALDIVQDAMTKLVNHYADRTARDWPLLFNKILESQLVDWHRRQSLRNRWHLWLEDFNDIDATTDTLLEPLATAQLPSQLESIMVERSMEELNTAFAALPFRQRQAFLLRVWEGLSVTETAAVMGCSSGSVKTHFSRATKQLQAHITEYHRD